MAKFPILTLTISDLDENGYGIARFEERKVKVLNALPGETAEVQIVKKRRGTWQGVAQQILQASPWRKEACEEHFLCCSPWQILDLEVENPLKVSLIRQFFQAEQIELPDFDIVSLPEKTWNYRNKAEFCFYSFDTGELSLAFFRRDTKNSKAPHSGCILMAESMNAIARKFLDFLRERQIQARQLKTVMLRYSYRQKKVVACLFVKDENLKFEVEELQSLLDETCQGLLVIYSTPKSPASVVTEIIHKLGNLELTEKILDVNLTYNWDNFFQTNPLVFEQTASDLRAQIKLTPEFTNLPVVDLYAGVGTLGLLVAPFVPKVLGVEVTPGSKYQAIQNAKQNGIENFDFTEALAENALETIENQQILIVDPPRAGLHDKLIEKIREAEPKHIIYLSCNPKTQAKNYAALQDKYNIRWMRGYNFYPHTPHIESLLVLDRK